MLDKPKDLPDGLSKIVATSLAAQGRPRSAARSVEATGEVATGVIQEDPTALLAAGAHLDCIVHGVLVRLEQGRAEGRFPLSSLFHGMLLAMVFRDCNGDHTAGSAVLVGPGIAICATHVIADFEDDLRSGRCSLLCGGPADHGVVLWLVRNVVCIPGSDLTILCMTLASAMPPQNQFLCGHLTTRTPNIGERVALYGLPARAKTVSPVQGDADVPVSACYTSGEVLEVHPLGRDRVMLPGPCFAVSCSAIGGMSGGPVFDVRGYLVGIVSTSSNGDAPVAFVSLLWPAMKAQAFPVWPKPRPLPSLSLLELSAQLKLVFIERPHSISNAS